MLSWYSVIFKGSDFNSYRDGMIRSAVMFTVFKRKHYNKSPLVWLSNYLYWQELNHLALQTLKQVLAGIDKYIAKNFHSILRSQTKETDDGKTIREKATAIDHQKETQTNFRQVFCALILKIFVSNTSFINSKRKNVFFLF